MSAAFSGSFFSADFDCPGWAATDPVVYANTAIETSPRIRPFMHHPPESDYGWKPFHTRAAQELSRLSIRRPLRFRTGTATVLLLCRRFCVCRPSRYPVGVGGSAA